MTRALLLLAFALSACGIKGDPIPPTPEAARAQEEVEDAQGF